MAGDCAENGLRLHKDAEVIEVCAENSPKLHEVSMMSKVCAENGLRLHKDAEAKGICAADISELVIYCENSSILVV